MNSDYAKDFGFGNYAVTIVDQHWITLSDGVRLSAKLWMPLKDDHEQIPAGNVESLYKPVSEPTTDRSAFGTILEYLPYRKDDWTANRDHNRHPWMTSHGFVVIRVDQRGCGNSEGLYSDEYEPQEQKDCIEVIDWIASQPWSNGNVGMYGKSWGGFNGLQVAFNQPPALKAIVSLYSTDDRFNTDIYYEGGSPILNGATMWSNQTFLWNARPPTRHAGRSDTEWRSDWLTRLKNHDGNWLKQKLAHSNYDDYWQHGSIKKNYVRIKAACLVVGGLVDGYTDGAFRMAAKLNEQSRGIVGPWSHDWPDVFQRENHPPKELYDVFSGQYHGYDSWQQSYEQYVDWVNSSTDKPNPAAPPPNIEIGSVHVNVAVPAHRETSLIFGMDRMQKITDENVSRRTYFDTSNKPYQGAYAGEWCPFSGNEWNGNQKLANEQSLTVQSSPLENELRICGQIYVTVSVNKMLPDKRGISVRLTHIQSPDTATLISVGYFNFGNHKPIAEHTYHLLYRVPLRFTTYTVPVGGIVALSFAPQAFPAFMPVDTHSHLQVCFAHTWLAIPLLPKDATVDNVCKYLKQTPKWPLLEADSQSLCTGEFKTSMITPNEQNGSTSQVPKNLKCRMVVNDNGTVVWKDVKWTENKVYKYLMADNCSEAEVNIKSHTSLKHERNQTNDCEINTFMSLRITPTEYIGNDQLHIVVDGEETPFYEKQWNYVIPRN